MSSRFKVGNPTLNPEIFQRQASEMAYGGTSARMTVGGTIAKSALLLTIVVAMAAVGWVYFNPVAFIGAAAVGLILGLVGFFAPKASPIIAPIYSVAMGYTIGAFSMFATMNAPADWKGIVPVAVLATMVVFASMLALYATRIIRVTQTFRMVVGGATLAIMLIYLGSFITGFFWPGVWQLPIYTSGPIGIGFSVLVIGLAAFNLAIDFANIEEGAQAGAPKFMEWYASFGLMVTIIWLYIEILRLLMKLQNR